MQIKKALKKALDYLKGVLLYILGLSLLGAASFLVTGKFTFLAYSERMFWAGMIVTLIGGVVGFAAGFAGRGFGIPVIIRRPDEAKRMLDNFQPYREEVERRYDEAIRLFVIGLGCIAVSALLQAFFA